MEERPHREGGLGRWRGPRRKAVLGTGGAGGKGPRRERRAQKKREQCREAGKEAAGKKKFTTKSIRCGGVSLQL